MFLEIVKIVVIAVAVVAAVGYYIYQKMLSSVDVESHLTEDNRELFQITVKPSWLPVTLTEFRVEGGSKILRYKQRCGSVKRESYVSSNRVAFDVPEEEPKEQTLTYILVDPADKIKSITLEVTAEKYIASFSCSITVDEDEKRKVEAMEANS